jgi:hypothetical protein
MRDIKEEEIRAFGLIGIMSPVKFIDLLKFQITNPKKQTNNNDRNSKSKQCLVLEGFGH